MTKGAWSWPYTESEGLHAEHRGGGRREALSCLIWIYAAKVVFVFDILLI